MSLKSLFKKWFGKREYDSRTAPFIIPNRGPKPKDGDKVETSIICPYCNTYFANATITLGAPFPTDKENFRVKEGYEEYVVLTPGKPLICPACSREFTDWAIQASVMAAINRDTLSRKFNEPYGFGQ